MTIPVKVCLKKLIYFGPQKIDTELEKIIADEVNVLECVYGGFSDVPRVELDCTETEETTRKTEERIKKHEIAKERKRLGLKIGDLI
jgi:Zn ribbon nucleic-acid-binding protein